MKIQIISSIILFCACGLTVVEVDGWDDRVLLDNVRALTLYKGKYTTGRRIKPIKQINCVGGDAVCSYEPDVVQCRNVGSDGTNPNWKCEANLPKSLKFGRLKVICEGYDYPRDPYILKGSCGLEYTLYHTNSRKSQKENYWFDENFEANYDQNFQERSTLFKAFFGTIWIGMIGFILYNVYLAYMRTRRADNRPFPNPPDGRTSNERQNVPQPQYPGFWTGILGGGLLGYLFGRRNNNDGNGYNRARRTRYERVPPSYSTGSSYFTRSNDDCHNDNWLHRSSNDYRSYTTTSHDDDDDKYTAYGFADTDVR